MNELIEQLINNAIPTINVPWNGEVEPMQKPCSFRYLCASDGLWFEVDLPWLYVRMPLAVQEIMRLPHGALVREYKLKGPGVSVSAIQTFIAECKAAPNSEAAGVITIADGKFRYHRLKRLPQNDEGIIRYSRLDLDSDEVVVCDMHCNGNSAPFQAHLRSGIQVDAVAKINVAIGHIGRDVPDVRFSLYINGLVLPVSIPA